MNANRYLVAITYTVDGTPRTANRDAYGTTPLQAKINALTDFAAHRDGRRVRITGSKVVY